MDPVSQAPETGRPGRYQRSTSGLIGAMVVLVLVVLGIVVYRGAFRETPTYEPQHLDYLELVGSVQRTGVTTVYPARLPEGWYAKDVTFTPGDRPVLDLALTTDNGRFAGVHQEDRSADELVSTYVDPDATEGPQVRLPGSVGGSWSTFSDSGGDHAFVTEVGDDTVIVYGSAGEDELRGLAASLTTKRVRADA
jgi:hypothetical protein